MRAKRVSRVTQCSREHLRFVNEPLGGARELRRILKKNRAIERDGSTDVGDSDSENGECVVVVVVQSC